MVAGILTSTHSLAPGRIGIMASERVKRQVDRLLDEVEQALTKFDRDAVKRCAEAVLRLDPDNQDALTFLAASTRSPSGVRATSGPRP